MRIGISFLTYEGQNIWSNGLGQNVIFLVQAFQKLPFVQKVILLNGGNQDTLPDQVDAQALGVELMRAEQATHEVDVVIEMACAFDGKWISYLRALGKKVIYYCAGQPYVGLIENGIFGRPAFFSASRQFDEVWLLPKDYAAFAPMTRALFRCPVTEVPYLWAPEFLARRVKEVEQQGLQFGYQKRVPDENGQKPGLRVAIFEPNISVVKASSIPMLICDEAFRAEPQSVNFMHALNTLHMVEHPTLMYLANSLDLVKQHKAVFPGRHDFAGYMAQNADAVVSHQWQNDQNYVYLDALYGNYPLIHNSPWLRDVGYYYPDFNTQAGAQQLLKAFHHHDDELAHHKRQADKVIQSVSPLHQSNLDGYARCLLQVCKDAKFLGVHA